MHSYALFATVPLGLEGVLAREIAALGAREVQEKRAGVACVGTLEIAYRMCLWSRVANRVLLPIARYAAPSTDALYEGARALDWCEHLSPDETLAVDVTSAGSALTHSRFAAQRVKDAVADHMREHTGRRPSVDTRAPDVRINVHVRGHDATVAIDLSGDSLHRRGYRGATGPAPLKENVAAAILLRAGWPSASTEGGACVDLMCGSGTFPIEAGLMAADVAPGLLRKRFGFSGWRQHDPIVWQRLVAEAHDRRAAVAKLPPIVGFDADARVIESALDNAARAGLAGRIQLETRALAAARAPAERGIVVINPPYGERLGDPRAAMRLHEALGAALRAQFAGYTAYVLTGSDALGWALRLRASRRNTVYNGALACLLLTIPLRAPG